MDKKSSIRCGLMIVWGVVLFYWAMSTGWRTYAIPEDWGFMGSWFISFLLIMGALEFYWEYSVKEH